MDSQTLNDHDFALHMRKRRGQEPHGRLVMVYAAIDDLEDVGGIPDHYDMRPWDVAARAPDDGMPKFKIPRRAIEDAVPFRELVNERVFRVTLTLTPYEAAYWRIHLRSPVTEELYYA